jgi:hypothetical protein
MSEIKTEFLFTIDLDFEFSVLGDTPYGIRRIARLKTGSFEGPKRDCCTGKRQLGAGRQGGNDNDSRDLHGPGGPG